MKIRNCQNKLGSTSEGNLRLRMLVACLVSQKPRSFCSANTRTEGANSRLKGVGLGRYGEEDGFKVQPYFVQGHL